MKLKVPKKDMKRLFDAVAPDDTHLYFGVHIFEKNAAVAQKKELQQLNYQAGEVQTLLTYGNSDWLFGAFDGKLVLLYFEPDSENSNAGLYRYTIFLPETREQHMVMPFSMLRTTRI